jgi:hypothetical protein
MDRFIPVLTPLCFHLAEPLKTFLHFLICDFATAPSKYSNNVNDLLSVHSTNSLHAVSDSGIQAFCCMLTEVQTKFVFLFLKSIFLITLRLYIFALVVKSMAPNSYFLHYTYNYIGYIAVVEKQHFQEKGYTTLIYILRQKEALKAF